MDRTEKRDFIFPFLVAGCFSAGFFEFACFFDTKYSSVFMLEKTKDNILSTALLFMLLGLTIVIYQQKCRLYSLIWVLSYFVGARTMWNMNDKKILTVFSYVMAILLLAVVILDIANIMSRAFMIAGRAIWFTVMIAQFSIMFYQMFYQEISVAASLFYGALFYMVLFSMTQTIPFLEKFSFSGTILGVSSPVLMAFYAFYRSDLIIEDPITILLYRLPNIVIAIIMMLYVIWIRKPKSPQRQLNVLSGVLTIQIGVLFSLTYIYCFTRAYSNDIGVRKLNAKTAYINQLNQDEYNWMEITRKEEMVSTTDLKYCIVDLDDGSMPVMFLSGDMNYAAVGDTRIVFYDETKQKPYQVWGNHDSIDVVGYIPSDKEHEYPLIFCEGGRQGLEYEFIYEVRNHNMYLIAEMYDVWPHEAEEIDSEFNHKADEYYWLGEEVSMVQYRDNRDEISNGYVEITWNN